jgi:ferric-dicitrate binding protein FerR (iron transport regulator)
MLDLDVRDPQPTDCDTADVSKASIPTGPFRALSHHRHVRSHHHHSGATVRGTQWQVTERCDGTLTRVLDGVVAVRDFTLHKTVLVHAGHSYLARAPGGVLDDDTGSHPGKDWSSGDAR